MADNRKLIETLYLREHPLAANVEAWLDSNWTRDELADALRRLVRALENPDL